MKPTVILALLLAALTQVPAQPNPDAALRAAIHKETVDGDLKAAIDQYRKLTHGKNRAVAAQALLRMGQCYEKRGDAEARKAYERLVRDFADQQEFARTARTRLAALTTSEADDSSNLRALPGRGFTYSVSPDGRFLFQSGPKGELNVVEVATQKVRQLAGAPFYQPVVSPDGRQVAFMRRFQNGQDTELRLVNFDGSGERLVWRSDKDLGAGAPQWFPDGKRILILQWDGSDGRRLLSVAADSGEATRQWEGKLIHISRLSPDGKYVTFMRHLRDEPINEQIWLLRLSDKTETLLFDGQSYMNYPDWAPDGSGVVFLSDRRLPGAIVDLWFLRVVEDKPSRFPILVKTGIGEMTKGFPNVWAAGLTRDGAYFFSKWTPTGGVIRQLMKINYDPETGRVSGAPSFVSPKGGQTLGHTMSRDGKWLSYIRQSSQSGDSIVVQSVESGEEKVVPMNPPPKHLQWVYIFPDGRSVLIDGTHPTEGRSLHRIEVQTGAWTTLIKSDPKVWGMWPGGISPDGKVIYFNRFTGKTTLTARNIETGAEREFRTGLNAAFALSPDGRRLASYQPDGSDMVIVIFPTDVGTEREIHRVSRQRGGGIRWTIDGKSLLFVHGSKSPCLGEVSMIPAEGGTPQSTGLAAFAEDNSVFPCGFSDLQFHPNGRELYYQAIGEERRPDGSTFALSNFLPGFKPAK